MRRRRREAIPVSAATTRSRTPDRLCAEAVDLARAAAEEAAAPGVVGEHEGSVSEGDRVVTHFFGCRELGYRGWRWAVTVARASRAKIVTVDEVVLLPGPDAVLAPGRVGAVERAAAPRRPGPRRPAAHGGGRPASGARLRGCGRAAAELGAEAVADGGHGGPRGGGGRRGHRRDAARADRHAVPGFDRRARGGTGHAPRPRPLPLRAARRRRPLGGGVRPEDPDGAGRARLLHVLRLPRPDRRLAGPGVRGVRERVLPGGRPGGLPAYGCGGHSEAAVMPKPPQRAPPVIDETRVDPFPSARPPTRARSRPRRTRRRRSWGTRRAPLRRRPGRGDGHPPG